MMEFYLRSVMKGLPFYRSLHDLRESTSVMRLHDRKIDLTLELLYLFVRASERLSWRDSMSLREVF